MSDAGPPQGALACPGAAYIGRFAPSCTGPLHAGSLVAALASWLDARAHDGVWLVRLEDADTQRCMPDMGRIILEQLGDCGLLCDEPAWLQSRRTAIYQQTLDQLLARDLVYPCACSRQDIETALRELGLPGGRHTELIYPGTCRAGPRGRGAHSWRLRTADAGVIDWTDRRLGPQQQDVSTQVGDFVLKRADGCFAYQLAVVVDDGAQGITHVVRGEDLADNTARQILLQRLLGLPTPRYLHTPLVLDNRGEKLSKQGGAPPLDTSTPAAALAALNLAAGLLGLPSHRGSPSGALSAWVAHWQRLYNRAP